ncbi:MAG TPA: DUF922 domain-containing protein [Polyangiaceae bacterium]|nr:DUF922 domain-containing protein [Polyangiaceae bacterium]
MTARLERVVVSFLVVRSFWVLLVAASAAVACGSGYTTLDEDEISGAARSGGGNSTGGSTGGTGGRGEATGGRAGSGAGGAGRGGTTSGGAGMRQGGAGGVGQAGAAGATAGAGSGGERPTSCDDPLAAGDVSRLIATDDLQTYAVMGNTADELRASINANRGRDYDALTTADINWTFRDCTNPTWSVALDIVYDMPEWNPPTNADPALVASFAAYIDALWCHEYGHGEIGIECANDLYDALSSIPATGDCVALQSTAEAETQRIVDVCRVANEQYDAETNHGATMGAVFPP